MGQGAKEKSAQEYRQQEKKQIKEMLKTEFGAFKNDSTVEEYVPDQKPKEDLKINWDPTKNNSETKDNITTASEESMKKNLKRSNLS